jgi:hypothetical protein
LKKSSKKLLRRWDMGPGGDNAHIHHSFFAAFFSKKEVLALPCVTLQRRAYPGLNWQLLGVPDDLCGHRELHQM